MFMTGPRNVVSSGIPTQGTTVGRGLARLLAHEHPMAMRKKSAAALWLLLSGCSVVGVHKEEQPRFSSLSREGDKEIRLYAPHLAATTHVAGDGRAAQRVAFSRLAGFIFGGNQSNTAIAMTAPVTWQPDSGTTIAATQPVQSELGPAGYRMTFSLPSQYSRASLPIPTDPLVQIVEVPAETLATLRFSWGSSPERIAQKTTELQQWLAQAHPEYEATGIVRYAGYDPPWTLPPFRHHEVMIPLRARAPQATLSR